MVHFKFVVDTLASLASLIAIISVLASWHRSARKPLRIERVVIHLKGGTATYILVVKNRKEYPVEIRRIEGYRTKKYTVQKKRGQKPEYSEGLPLTERVLATANRYDIGASGHTDIRIEDVPSTDRAARLLFSLTTSHGYHEIWCENLVYFEIGKVEVYSVEYKHQVESKWKAKALYLGAWLKELRPNVTRASRHR